MGFSQHGTFEVYVEGRILYEQVAYPINMETFRRMVADTWAIMRDLIDTGPWGMIVTISGEPLPPADVAQAYAELGRDAARNRCARVSAGREATRAMPSCNWSRKP